MRRSIALVIILFIGRFPCIGQDEWLKSIKLGLDTAKSDTSRVMLMSEYSNYYKLKRPDSALYYGYEALTLARKIDFPRGEVRAMEYVIITQSSLGNDAKALQLSLQAEKIAEKNNLLYDKALIATARGMTCYNSGDFIKALKLFNQAKIIFTAEKDIEFLAWILARIGDTYLSMNQRDSALYYGELAYHRSLQNKDNWATAQALITLGNVQKKLGNNDLALNYFNQAISNALEVETLFSCYLSIAQFYHQVENIDSSILYGKKAYQLAQENGFNKDIIDASLLLLSNYEERDPKQAIFYSKKALAYRDTITNLNQSSAQEAFTDFDARERQREIDLAKSEFQNRLRIYSFLGISFTLLVIALFLYRNNKLKQRAKQHIERAYDQLKATQAQLIQSEKMASLGELMIGIAHEIQNPLNFVNNFSEVNTELIDELKTERVKPYRDEHLELELLDDIRNNQEKINHHGKRADAIVKGMLQHSRTGSGIKELTDINALATEFLRLSYHGFRSKDESFNATIKTDFEPGIGKINVIPQDIGRVLLNLYNNAFYAVSEKKSALDKGAMLTYEPTVSVITKKEGKLATIHIRDSGNGIQPKVLDKIFQPFFTTKPTGQGTGLGLSLAYDIVKAHGGQLKVETKEGQGTEFIIELPLA